MIKSITKLIVLENITKTNTNKKQNWKQIEVILVTMQLWSVINSFKTKFIQGSVASDASSQPALTSVVFVSELPEKNRVPLAMKGLRTADGDRTGYVGR